MSSREILPSPPSPRPGVARDLSSRLYREIGLAAVEAALCKPERSGLDRRALRESRIASGAAESGLRLG